MSDTVTALVSVLTALIGLAALSVILSKNANTTGVIQAGSTGFSGLLTAATAPVSGGGLGTLPSLGNGMA